MKHSIEQLKTTGWHFVKLMSNKPKTLTSDWLTSSVVVVCLMWACLFAFKHTHRSLWNRFLLNVHRIVYSERVLYMFSPCTTQWPKYILSENSMRASVFRKTEIAVPCIYVVIDSFIHSNTIHYSAKPVLRIMYVYNVMSLMSCK